MQYSIKKAVADMNLDAEVEYITDFMEVASYGVMRLPALIVNNKAVSMGKVLKTKDILKFLK